jgi:hypothetical protein
MARGKAPARNAAPAKKSAPAKKTAPKKVVRTSTEAPAIRPFKETLTKSALINLIAEQNDLPRKTAVAVFSTLEDVILGSVHPRGVGEFTLSGLFKISLRKVPARRLARLFVIRRPEKWSRPLRSPLAFA